MINAAINTDCKEIYKRYKILLEQSQQLGNLVGASGGGEGGNWGGSMPKLISILPMGNWEASSLKRSRTSTKSGFMSDHYEGNKIAYAADFGLNSTFYGNVKDATNFALKIAQRVDPSVKSWEPYKGNSFKKITPDGYRVQIIWLSNVGGNHYDHVHVGVKKTTGASDVKYQSQQDEAQNDENKETENNDSGENTDASQSKSFTDYLKSLAAPLTKDFSLATAQKALSDVLGSTASAIQSTTGKDISKYI